MLITLEPHGIFDYLYSFFFFLKLAGKVTNKRKQEKEKNICHAWTRTTECQPVGPLSHHVIMLYNLVGHNLVQYTIDD